MTGTAPRPFHFAGGRAAGSISTVAVMPAERHDVGRHLVDMDADRDALGQAHPGEDRVDGRDPLPVGLRVRHVDGAGDAVDVTEQDLAVAHELDAGRIADADRSEVRLLEIAVDPE